MARLAGRAGMSLDATDKMPAPRRYRGSIQVFFRTLTDDVSVWVDPRRLPTFVYYMHMISIATEPSSRTAAAALPAEGARYGLGARGSAHDRSL